MLFQIENLHDIAERCCNGDPLDPEQAHWLGQCLNEFLSQGADHLDEAFGLRAMRGGVPWRTEYAMRVRDSALRALARKLDQSISLRARVLEIRRLTVSYAASTWRWDKSSKAMPPHYSGTIKEHIWTAFQSGAPMPIGERRLYQIVAD
jgi:hypothetical protein